MNEAHQSVTLVVKKWSSSSSYWYRSWLILKVCVFSKEDSPDAPEILDATCISTSLTEKEFAQLINSLTKDKGYGHEPS